MTDETILAAVQAKSDPAEQAAYLADICAGNAERRQRLADLLAASPVPRSVGGRLESPTVAPIEPENAASRTHNLRQRRGQPEVSESFAFLSPPVRPDSLGRLGHYEMLSVLGQGGFGIVFRAFDCVLHRIVAVKVLSPQMAATSPARKRFLREARSSAQVRHENVVQVYEVGEEPLPYLAMEFIPSETLQDKLDRTGPLDVADVLRIGRQLAEGLAAAHSQSLIHRDIKPANILIETGVNQQVKITDFGLARAADDASITQSGVIAGTPMYMAPEQAQGQKLDHRADLFSLGSVLYQIVTGRPPFRANGALAVMKRVVEDTPRPIQEIIPETPTWLCDIINRLHAKEPRARFQSARELADVLAECETQLKANVALKNAPRPAVGSRRWKWIAGVAALLLPVLGLALAEAVGVTHLFRSRERQADSSKSDPETPPNAALDAPKNEPPQGRTPFSDADVQRIAALPADTQFAEVQNELRRRNPDFEGTIFPTFKGDAVIGLRLVVAEGKSCRDISPIRALTRLEQLSLQCGLLGKDGLAPLRGLPLKELEIMYDVSLRDLTPLKGLRLERLNLWGWTGTDLTPLQDMPLKWLNCGGGAQKIDLATLAKLPLDYLNLNNTLVKDLNGLKGSSVKKLSCTSTPLSDLTHVRHLRLEYLNIVRTRVSDLSPLRETKLTELWCQDTKVKDLSPLANLPLIRLDCTIKGPKDLDILRSIKTLETINGKPAAVFWKSVEK